MLVIWSLVPMPFLNPVWTSGSSWSMYYWSLAWRILGITLLLLLWDECSWVWGHRLPEGTGKTLCSPGPRGKEQWPHFKLNQPSLTSWFLIGLTKKIVRNIMWKNPNKLLVQPSICCFFYMKFFLPSSFRDLLIIIKSKCRLDPYCLLPSQHLFQCLFQYIILIYFLLYYLTHQ